MMAGDRQAQTEQRLRQVMAQLLAGDIPEGMKCDVTSLCSLAGVPRATFYRTYPHVRADFDAELERQHASGSQPDPRLDQIDRLKQEVTELRRRLSQKNTEVVELQAFRENALSQIAAQHEEILALRKPPSGDVPPPRFRAVPLR
jgi:AcrR family transcriptional regulator